MTQALTALAVTHHEELRYLAEHPGEAPGMVARALGKDPSNARRAWPKLEEEGFIKNGALTARGRAALDVMDGSKAAPRPGNIIGAIWAAIGANPHNPRKTFDPQELEDLSDSIVAKGLLQNLVVRDAPPDEANGVRFWIVAGERRWRAIGIAIERGDWPEDRLIPVKVTDLGELAAREVSLVENVQRVALPPLEEARAFQELYEIHGRTTAEIARGVGKTQRFVQQRLQLLDLDATSQAALAGGMINVEQARRLVAKPKAPEPEAEPTPLLDEIEARGGGNIAPALDVTLPHALRYTGAVDLLRAVALHPRQTAGCYWSACGVKLKEGEIRRRLRGFADAGLVDQAAGPTITDAGVDVLRRIEGLPELHRADGDPPASTMVRDELLERTNRRLEAAEAALARDGAIIAGIRRVTHDELWEPGKAIVFLKLVLLALRA